MFAFSGRRCVRASFLYQAGELRISGRGQKLTKKRKKKKTRGVDFFVGRFKTHPNGWMVVLPRGKKGGHARFSIFHPMRGGTVLTPAQRSYF